VKHSNELTSNELELVLHRRLEVKLDAMDVVLRRSRAIGMGTNDSARDRRRTGGSWARRSREILSPRRAYRNTTRSSVDTGGHRKVVSRRRNTGHGCGCGNRVNVSSSDGWSRVSVVSAWLGRVQRRSIWGRVGKVDVGSIKSGVVSKRVDRRRASMLRIVKGVVSRSIGGSRSLPGICRAWRQVSFLRLGNGCGSWGNAEKVTRTPALLESWIELSDGSQAQTWCGRHGSLCSDARSRPSSSLHVVDLGRRWRWGIMHINLLVVPVGRHLLLLAAVDEEDTDQERADCEQDTESQTGLGACGHATCILSRGCGGDGSCCRRHSRCCGASNWCGSACRNEQGGDILDRGAWEDATRVIRLAGRGRCSGRLCRARDRDGPSRHGAGRARSLCRGNERLGRLGMLLRLGNPDNVAGEGVLRGDDAHGNDCRDAAVVVVLIAVPLSSHKVRAAMVVRHAVYRGVDAAVAQLRIMRKRREGPGIYNHSTAAQGRSGCPQRNVLSAKLVECA
jgi:hypothetical protein